MRVKTLNRRAKLKLRIRVERESFLFHERRARKLLNSGKIDKLFRSSYLKRDKRKRKLVKSLVLSMCYGMGLGIRQRQWLTEPFESQN